MDVNSDSKCSNERTCLVGARAEAASPWSCLNAGVYESGMTREPESSSQAWPRSLRSKTCERTVVSVGLRFTWALLICFKNSKTTRSQRIKFPFQNNKGNTIKIPIWFSMEPFIVYFHFISCSCSFFLCGFKKQNKKTTNS